MTSFSKSRAFLFVVAVATMVAVVYWPSVFTFFFVGGPRVARLPFDGKGIWITDACMLTACLMVASAPIVWVEARTRSGALMFGVMITIIGFVMMTMVSSTAFLVLSEEPGWNIPSCAIGAVIAIGAALIVGRLAREPVSSKLRAT